MTSQPKLSRLELQGFKSFTSRTVFAFEPGITAIIGPNGSGKSNISDAVRWVLGETSYGALRSKRTEDVIFAGGSGRAPAGMAEVAVTFNNEEGWLPIEFSEVTVTRRAFRTGESQYLINGRRVRLKDITHLTASLGQSHTVVGQGLVDAALSQRAEERRGLFEHAADLTGLRLKVAEAERSLTETETNSARLTDLLTELEPRLRTLSRAARQAQEWKGVQARLFELQRSHYAHLLAAAQHRLASASEAAAAGEAAVLAGQAEVDRLAGEHESARIAAENARATLAQHDARLQSTIDQARRIGHERDLTAERHAALTRRREDMADTQSGLDEQVASVNDDLATLEQELAAIEAEVASARDAVSKLQAEGASARQTRSRLERRASELSKALGELDRRASDLTRRRALLEQRRETSGAERERAEATTSERAKRIAGFAAEMAAFEQAELDDAHKLAAVDTRLSEVAENSERAADAVRAAREAVNEAERRVGQAAARLEALQRLHESGTGLHAGVRATLDAARDGKLEGIRGTVAELIDVPATYETAIEVALGGRLQDIVVERWADAEAAIAALKRANAGRATFQPLDTVQGRGARSLPRETLALPGVHGVAADLVKGSTELRGVMSALLGRTLVVNDLPVARQTLPSLPTGWSTVTLGGEIARTGGSVTGGAAVRESGILSRERELRELPKEIRRLERVRDKSIATQQTAAEEPLRIAAERQDLEGQRAGLLAARKERQTQRNRLAGWLSDLRQEQESADRRAEAMAASLDTLASDLEQVGEEHHAVIAAIERTRAEHEAVQAELSREVAVAAAGDRAHAAEQRRLATLEERLRAEHRRQTGLLSQQRALADELALRGERAAALDGERAALSAQHERLVKEAAAMDAAHETVVAERGPLESASRRAETEGTRLGRAVETARSRLLDLERAHGASSLDLERARGEVATIHQRIEDDLDLDDPASLLHSVDDHVMAAEQPAPDVEREIARLKERLRRVGYVGEDVVEEYEREASHQEFLRGQLADVEEAAASLRLLLSDLQAQMRERFDATFARVADAFTETFTTLFGGGTARLVMAATEDGSQGGIDIVAQPPGKRLQSLALLSGGERALTAAALLFAILRVNPTPFVLLDEVDAALDEANIVRFREQLQALAADTQAIIITHNRGTIEIADTLYGVSMGADGVSQVLSLRMAEVAPVV